MSAPTRLEQGLAAVVAGLLFGGGLALSGMVIPDKVLNFLDITGAWDPSLAVVMASALAVALPAFFWQRRRSLRATVNIPERIDARLCLGSVLFGLGWGIAGICPGPALANLAGWGQGAWVFLLAMIAGSQLTRWLDRGKR